MRKTPEISSFIGCESSFENAGIVLFGAPFDGTTSYRPGTRFAPAAIRRESYGIETYSPYQDKDLGDYQIFDSGDLELPFGNTEKVLSIIEETAGEILDSKKIPFMVGGEHLVTLGAVRAAAKRYQGLKIIHFDAHTDLREEYLGETLSHATVLRRCWEIVGDDSIWQYGIRSGEREEFYWAKEHTHLHPFDLNGLSEAVNELKGYPVYLTVDLDVLDPAYFCGTGTPEAGGTDFMTLLNSLVSLRELNIIGADMNELSPPYDQSGASTALACKLLREMLLILSPSV